jgi:hypothetical protein
MASRVGLLAPALRIAEPRRASAADAGRDLAPGRLFRAVRPIDDVFEELGRTEFRRRFTLQGRELAYLERKGLNTVLSEGERFLSERIASAEPRNDGRQTPWRNHPIFVAQHATGTCCRGCLDKLHGIPKGHELSAAERAHVVAVWRRWLSRWDPMQGNRA